MNNRDIGHIYIKHFLFDIDYILIFYYIAIVPTIIPTGHSLVDVVLLAIPGMLNLIMCTIDGRRLVINRSILFFLLLPVVVVVSRGGTTAIAYACRYTVSILCISQISGDYDEKYSFFIRVVKFIGLLIAITLLFEYFFVNAAICAFTPLWKVLLHNELSLEQTIACARLGLIYGIIPSASYAGEGLTYAIGAYISKEHKRSIDWIAISILLIALLLSSRRSNIIFLVFSILFLLLITTSKNKFAIRLLITALICVLLCISFYFMLPYVRYSTHGIGRLFTTLKYIGNPIMANKLNLTSNRSTLAQYALEQFRENKLFGIGWGNFTKRYLQYSGEWYMNVHNVYLQLLCETGIVGTFVIVMLFGGQGIRSIKMFCNSKYKYYFVTFIIVFSLLEMSVNIFFDLPQCYLMFFLSAFFLHNKDQKIKDI